MNRGYQQWNNSMKSTQGASGVTNGQPEMFPLTLTGIRPGVPQGQHIEFIGDAGGEVYYCKRDRVGMPLPAIEWFCSNLASHLGIPVPDFAQIRNPENEEVLFGSKQVWGTAGPFEAQTFLTTPSNYDPAIGDPYSWLGPYLSRLYAFDLFIGNPDRQVSNFLLTDASRAKKLIAFDFASADFRLMHETNFPIAETQTLSVGRQVRRVRKFDTDSALELIDRIAAIPITVIEGILTSMAENWMSENRKGEICEHWQKDRVQKRLAALRSGVRDESLL